MEDLMKNKQPDSGSNMPIIGTAIVGALGTLAAVYLSRKDNREKVKKVAKDISHKTVDTAKNVSEKAKDKWHGYVDSMEETADTVETKIKSRKPLKTPKV